jgi:Flp pilus assembly protein TadG
VLRVRRLQTAARGQAFVETMLVLPLFLLLLFATVDIARAAYTWVMLGQDAAYAARQASLADNQLTDCSALSGTASAGNGVSISADPKSLLQDGDPGQSPQPYTTPTTANTGFVYIWPAQATADPPAANCSSTSTATARQSGTVTAVVTYDFTPWTPLLSSLIPSIALTARASEQTQY